MYFYFVVLLYFLLGSLLGEIWIILIHTKREDALLEDLVYCTYFTETFLQTYTSNFWRVPTYPLLADCKFPPSDTPLWTWMLTPFITAYPSEVTSKNALYQVRFSLTPAAATVLPVSVALSLPPFEVKACRFWYCLAFVCNFCSHH